MPKAGFISLGCPKNLVDSEVMMGILARNGYELTPRADEADVLVVNTCSFIAPAQQESIDTILEMAEHKKFGAREETDRRRLPGGALSRRRSCEQIPEVDAVIGTGEVESILEAVEGELRCDAAASAPLSVVSLSRSHAAHALDAAPRRLHQDRRGLRSSLHVLHHPAIAREIPQPPLRIRGARSGKSGRRRRARSHADRPGHHFLRRRSRPARRPGRCCWSASRTSKACSGCASSTAIPIASRSACSTRIAAHPRLAKYMDMPLQHASRNVLARMKRGSNGDAFLQLLERIRATIPGVVLRTSFIVGFPGETEADFRELCDFVRAAEFDWMGVFAYSDVDNAASYALDEKVDAETIAERRDRLMAMQQQHFRAQAAALSSASECPRWSKARRRTPNWSGKRASKAWRRKSTASSI